MSKLIHVLGLLAASAVAAAQTKPEPATVEKVAVLPPEAAAAIAREVAAELKAQDFPALESRFDEAMKAALPEAQLAVFWSQTLERAGALRTCGEPRTQVSAEFTLAFSPCTFEKQKAELRLTLRPDGRIAGMFLAPETDARRDWTPPPYVVPAAFTEREATVASGIAKLPATISMPKGKGPFPGIVLVHGSGPHDRDETVGGARVFQDLAQGLASRGVAVLRYEKRTKTYQKELAGTRDITLRDEVVDDALAALKLLRTTPGVDPARVSLLGHSLGGILAPRIASEDGKTASLVLLATPSRPMSEVVHDQVAFLTGSGAGPAQQAAAASLRAQAQALADLYAGRPPGDAMIFGAAPAYWLELKAQTPTSTAAKLGIPILVLQGGRDYQVSAKDFAGWKAALEGTPRATLKTYPALNHLFVAGEGPSTPAEYEKPGHVAPEVVEDLASFAARGALRRPEGAKK